MGKKSEKMCPLIAFDQIFGGKYKLRILWDLRKGGLRYGEIRKSLIVNSQGKEITARILSRELKELARLGLIIRKQYPVVPPKVEYRLSEEGERVIPVVDKIAVWGLEELESGRLKRCEK